MAIGERIHFFRNLRGMTQKYLGQLLAQYETGTRSPKADLTVALAQALDVSPQALAVPDIDSQVGLMHTFFTLEDRYGLQIAELDDEICLRVDVRNGKEAAELHEMLCKWQEQFAKLKTGEISQEDYDRWRYHYPENDTSRQWAKVPSATLSDMLFDISNKKFK